MRPALAIAALALLAAAPAAADDLVKVGALSISAAWSRATPKGAPVGGGYLTIRNDGASPDRLVAASTPVSVKVDIHQMRMDGSVMVMRPVAGGVEIPPGQTVTFEPNGYHLMLEGLKQSLAEGQTLPVTLTFQNAGTVSVDFAIGSIGARGPAATMQHPHMNAPAGAPMHQH